jgi:replicative DNA helicase
LDPECDLVVTPRRITYTPDCFDLKDAEVKLLAYWVTDGSIEPSRGRARYCDGRLKTVKEVVSSLEECGFTTSSEPYQKNGAWEVQVGKFKTSGFEEWASRRGILNKKTATVEVPDVICRAPLNQIALFINRVWAAEGTVSCSKGSHQPSVQLGMKSERFIRQIQLLLLRFGIQSRITETNGERNGTPWKVWTLYISDKENITRFFSSIGTVFAKEAETQAVSCLVESQKSAPVHDYLPLTVKEAGKTVGAPIASRNRQLTRRYLDTLISQNQAFSQIKSNYSDDIAFTPIKRKEVLNPITVADIGVPGPHTFVANGLTVHNSIGW